MLGESIAMTIYAEAECATCFAIQPKNEMRQVVVRRVTGESFGQGSATGSSSNNSMSYGGSRPARMRSGQGQSTRRHSNKRVHMATERLWVCQGCQAPKSDWSPAMKQGLLYALGGGGVLVYMLMGGFSQPVKAPVAAARAEPVQAMGASVSSGEEVTNAPANPDALLDPLSADLGATASPEEGSAATDASSPPPTNVLSAAPVEAQAESASKTIASTASQDEAEVRRAKQAEAQAAEQRRFCDSVTPEGRANAAYMASIGC
jgi:hypothetical protein